MSTIKLSDPTTILQVENLSVSFVHHGVETKAVDDVNFNVHQGESIGIVGESGSGKSVTALSIMNLLLSPPAVIKSGKIYFRSNFFGVHDILKLSNQRLAAIRGNEIAMIFQEPMSSLNPVFTCGNQVKEALRIHTRLGEESARTKTLGLFEEVQLDDPGKIYRAYPHELSGGQKQRVMIAMAMSCNPSILIADEPTTALDVTVQSNILKLMENLRENHDTSLIFISHDLGVIAEIADRIIVMYKGKIVEMGNVFQIFNNPQHPYTKGLLACRPRLDIKLRKLPTVNDFMANLSNGNGEKIQKYNSIGEALLLNAELKRETIQKRLDVIQGGPILRVKNLCKTFPIKKGLFGHTKEAVKAVDDVSFEIYPGETVGLVGESGCGKTTLGRTLIRLVDPDSGEIIFDGNSIHEMKSEALRQLRKKMQIIFQDPYSSLNPRQTIGEAIIEPLKIHKIINDKKARKERAFELLQTVGLSPSHIHRFPHEFSGGQRQRVCIARALATNPQFIICDESVSALDVSVQAQVLNLLNELKQEFKFTYLFISHDLSVIKFMADRIFVMNKGKLIEIGYPDALFDRPKESYTGNLIEAIPRGDIEDIRKAQLRRRLAYARKSLFPNE
ncbi:MAG: ABC transporter ATP-binding protein [Cytophagales bacterium]|nr:ABC transporter ATP-binding protein [Cytophagales bacterium]